jgi:hypothetical protein
VYRIGMTSMMNWNHNHQLLESTSVDVDIS